MAKGILRDWSAIAILGTAGAALCCLPLIGDAASATGPAHRCRPADSQPQPGAPQIDCPAPPNPFDVTPFFSADASVEAKALAGPSWDSWAWATFAALNWPAVHGADRATYPSGFERGVPDLGASFAAAANDQVLVWETFKEKRELFQLVKTDPAHQMNRYSR